MCVVLPSALETVGGEAGGVWRHFTKAKPTCRCSQKYSASNSVNELKMPVKSQSVNLPALGKNVYSLFLL